MDGPAHPQRVYRDIVARGHSRNHFGDAYYAAPKKTRRERLLESLAFDGMYHPRELEAFEGTYEWIFDEGRDTKEASIFADRSSATDRASQPDAATFEGPADFEFKLDHQQSGNETSSEHRLGGTDLVDQTAAPLPVGYSGVENNSYPQVGSPAGLSVAAVGQSLPPEATSQSGDDGGLEDDLNPDDLQTLSDHQGLHCLFGDLERPRTSFPEWARHDNDLFWVTGKAGSRKSTLMRFISEDDRTCKLLQGWAGESELVIANFFFWNAGNKMQKSKLGLMQGLLYQIVDQSEDIKLERISGHRRTDDEFAWKRPWKRKELSQALKSLVGDEDMPLKRHFCFFVDGLDEYESDALEEGTHADLVEYVETLAKCASVKVCVSSRPWNTFEDAYAGLGRFKISMHELTAADMRVFVQARLSDDPRFAALLVHEQAAELAVTIQKHAAGVFLWVVLAVNDIRRGLCEGDSVETLQKRLAHLPQELDIFLERIFQSIEPVYQQLAARVLLMVLRPFRLSLLELSYLEELTQNPDSALSAPINVCTSTEVSVRLERAKRSINKWCKGLVEVIKAERGYITQQPMVDFSHRTIADYIRSREESGEISRLAGSSFSVALTECSVQLFLAKSVPEPGNFQEEVAAEPRNIQEVATSLLEGARDAAVESDNRWMPLLEELDRVCSEKLAQESDVHWSDEIFQDKAVLPCARTGFSLMALLAYYRLEFSALRVLDKYRDKHTKQQLHFALATSVSIINSMFTGSTNFGGDMDVLSDLVKSLLLDDLSLDVNEQLLLLWDRPCSVWQALLTALMRSEFSLDNDARHLREELMTAAELLLSSGADPDVEVFLSRHERSQSVQNALAAFEQDVAESFYRPERPNFYRDVRLRLERASQTKAASARGTPAADINPPT